MMSRMTCLSIALLVLTGPVAAQQTDADGEPPTVTEPPARPAQEGCPLAASEVMDRYHALGENYLAISQIVDESDALRVALGRQLRDMPAACPDAFVSANRERLERLGNLPIGGWFSESDLLSRCIGHLNNEVQARLENLNPVALTRRLMQQADDYRRVESDLTNIARELAYYHNKQHRLRDAFRTHLHICEQFE